MTAVDVAPTVLDWAIARGGNSVPALTSKFPHLDRWRHGDEAPSIKDLESFAKETNTPFGYLLLDAPPVEEMPVTDFRVRAGTPGSRPSANLLDQMYLCESRQAWYADYAREGRIDIVSQVGSMTTAIKPEHAAATIRADLRLNEHFASQLRDSREMRSALIERIEELGFLVMVSGVVGTNTHRPLDPEEFSGFSLKDPHAPVIFANGVETYSAQVFTIIHELAHLYLGDSALSRTELRLDGEDRREKWCNLVAALALVPGDLLRNVYDSTEGIPDQLDRLAHFFKVSTLVILRRLQEIGKIARKEFGALFEAELERIMELLSTTKKKRGGSFATTTPVRSSKRFTKALLRSTLEGATLYTEAFALLGTRKTVSILNLAKHLGVS